MMGMSIKEVTTMVNEPGTLVRTVGSGFISQPAGRTSARKSQAMSEEDYRNFIRKKLDKARRTSPGKGTGSLPGH